ncbi:uncharacterized protein LOC129791446 isoform X2 [Lutzomyia longipalpis]|uniref:uncharacterized protein LOC129791446 isoform X2 n=1 Tax=Lutzomyia longipalpis TaxID=7200 RepID=UPI002483E3C3|nr:uncharacterized protein LOC129791446 isoform X2 [Lutzomyia longipalpis]
MISLLIDGGLKKYWKKYNLRQFVEALMSQKVQKSLEYYKDHIHRYVIITNNSVARGKVESIVENCEGFNDVFKKFLEDKSVVIKFGLAFNNEMQHIIDAINEESKDKSKLHQLEASFLLDKIVILSNVPNYEDLEGLCDKFVKSIFANNYSDLMPRFLRQNLNDFIKPINNKRKFVNETNFAKLIELSIQEVELTRMTETFIQSVKFHAKFDKEIIEDFRNKLEGKKIIECDGSEKLSVLKVYDALKSSEVKVFLLQLSLLTKSYENCFKLPKSKIIIYVDFKINFQHLLQYENIIFIVSKGCCIEKNNDSKIVMSKPKFEEFDVETKKSFLRKKINFQGSSVALCRIYSLIHNNTELAMSFFDNLAEEFANRSKVTIGTEFTKKAEFYIMRYFSVDPKNDLNDQELLKDYSNVVIVGDPGMGKTLTTVKLANNLKTEFPNFWVGVIFLSDLTKIFSEHQSFDHWSTEDFILRILVNNQENLEFCKILLRIFLKEEKSSPIAIFFDGYDEIYPQYSEIVQTVISKLRELNVRIYITTRSHCEEDLKRLGSFSFAQMHLFKEFQRNIFMRTYIKLKYPDDDVDSTITRINQAISSEVFDEKFIGTPILLRMIIDICKKSVNYAENLKNLTIFKIYDDIFEMSFDSYYAKERIDATKNTVAGKRNLELKRTKEIYSFIAIREVGMEKVIPHNFIEFTEIEVMARGFVTRITRSLSDDSVGSSQIKQYHEFRFIHRTFAEYFVGEAICGQIMKQNFNLMKYINDHWKEQISQFAYLSILDKAQKGILEFNADTLEGYCKIFRSLYFSRKSTNEQDFAIFVKYIKGKLSSEQFVDFLVYQFQAYKQMTQKHIDFLLNFLEGECETSAINNLLSVLVSKNFTDKKYFHTDFQNLLISRGVQTDGESFEKIYKDFGDQYRTETQTNLMNMSNLFRKNTNYSKDVHFAVFENRRNTIVHDVRGKIMTKYADINQFDTQDTVFMNYLALYLDESSNFLRDLLEYFFEKKILMAFFRKLSRTYFNIDETVNPFSIRAYSIEDCSKFIGMCIKIFMENHWERVDFEGKSLIYYCWTSEDKLIMTPFLDHLPMGVITDLAASPKFNGKSAIEYFHTDHDATELPLNYLEYLYKTLPRDDFFNLIVPSQNPNAYRKNISLFDNLYCSMRNNVVDEETYDAMTEKIAVEIIKELQEKQLNLLYPFACNYFYIGLQHPLIDILFDKLTKLSEYIRSFGERKNYYIYCLKQVNEEGDNLLHIAAKNNNNDFLEYLAKTLSIEELIEYLKVKNYEGKNYFHCVTDTVLWKKKIKLPQKDLSEILLDQDLAGRTPFHKANAEFFMSCSTLFTEDDLIALLKIQDTEGNNMLHHLAKDPSTAEDTRELKLFIQLVIQPRIKNEMRNAYLVPNKDGKTAKDLGLFSF